MLREAGLVSGEVDGPATCYCLNVESIRWLKDQVGAWLPTCCQDAPPPAETDSAGAGQSQLLPPTTTSDLTVCHPEA